VITIAEIAQGFEGKPSQAALLIKAAASARANGVKLQLVYADELCTPDYKHYELFKSLEMADSEWTALHHLSGQLGVEMYLDVFGERSLMLAESMGIAGIKVHSTDMGNIGLLQRIGTSRVPTILLSAGGCHADEIEAALGAMCDKRVILMHGFQGYPTRLEDNQLARMHELRDRYGRIPGVRFGFADHVSSDDPMRFVLPAIVAGMGVDYYEKHITLGTVMKLEDHESAMNPDEFALCVSQIRKCAVAIGRVEAGAGDFGMSESETRYRNAMHKHVVASRGLSAGTVLTPETLSMKRTSATDAIYEPSSLLGKRLIRSVGCDQPITPAMVSG
jgi:N,N'-diacetyllegionaminate synthase